MTRSDSRPGPFSFTMRRHFLPFAALFTLLLLIARAGLRYQGESNTVHPHTYRTLFTAMIEAWRSDFRRGDRPFYWVNLAGFKMANDATDRTWAYLREAQTQTLALPQTGQAIAVDIGDYQNIHPKNKAEAGRRLALLARNRIYGLPGEDTGPTFAGVVREGAAMRIHFTHAAGLASHDFNGVFSVEIAGIDRIYHPAVSKVEGETVLATARNVPEPVAVRYAWRNCPDANLYNGAGLPAVPFRSEKW